MVKRFDVVGEYDHSIKEVEGGDYVLYSDYKKLEEVMDSYELDLDKCLKDYIDFGNVSRKKLGIQCQYLHAAIEILNEIISKGFFVYESALWKVENDMAIKELLDSGIVQRESDIRPNAMNGEYVYIEKKVERK